MENNNIEKNDFKDNEIESKKKKIIKILGYSFLTLLLIPIVALLIVYSFGIGLIIPFILGIGREHEAKLKAKCKELYLVSKISFIGGIVLAIVLFICYFIVNN